MLGPNGLRFPRIANIRPRSQGLPSQERTADLPLPLIRSIHRRRVSSRNRIGPSTRKEILEQRQFVSSGNSLQDEHNVPFWCRWLMTQLYHDSTQSPLVVVEYEISALNDIRQWKNNPTHRSMVEPNPRHHRPYLRITTEHWRIEPVQVGVQSVDLVTGWHACVLDEVYPRHRNGGLPSEPPSVRTTADLQKSFSLSIQLFLEQRSSIYRLARTAACQRASQSSLRKAVNRLGWWNTRWKFVDRCSEFHCIARFSFSVWLSNQEYVHQQQGLC